MSAGDELLRRARSGAQGALAELIEACRPTVRAFLARRVGARMERFVSISDIEQEIMLGGVQALDRLEPNATLEDFKALLQRHAHWAIGKTARSGRRFAGESEAPDLDTPAPRRTLRSGAVTRADELAWLGAHIAALPEGERAVVERRLAGNTFEAIADDLGLGASAVRKRYLHAARRLREAGG